MEIVSQKIKTIDQNEYEHEDACHTSQAVEFGAWDPQNGKRRELTPHALGHALSYHPCTNVIIFFNEEILNIKLN